MIEPTSSNVGAVVGGLGALSALISFEAQLDAVLLGLFASMLATGQLDKIDSFWKAVSAVFFSGLASGVFTDPVSVWLVANLPGTFGVQPSTLRMPVAFVIGALLPTLWPIVRRKVENQVEKGGNK